VNVGDTDRDKIKVSFFYKWGTYVLSSDMENCTKREGAWLDRHAIGTLMGDN
jgi:hypothetical protein